MADRNCRHSSAYGKYAGNSQIDRVLRALPAWWAPLLDTGLSWRKSRFVLGRFMGSVLLRSACLVARLQVWRMGGV